MLGINTISMAKINVEINQNHKFVSIGLSVKLKCGLLLSKPTNSLTGGVSVPQYMCRSRPTSQMGEIKWLLSD